MRRCDAGCVPTTEGVFDDFVRARWEDLEPAARVVVLDPGVAREVTAGALAGLRTRWAGVVEEGRPADEARRLVLVGALARSPVERARAGPRDGAGRRPVGTRRAAAPWGAEEDGVVTALVDHLRGLEPLERALLAARQVWGAGPEDVARWLDRAAPALAQRAEVVDRGLEEAHTTAREREGAVPAPWALERDLARAVDTLLGGLTDPPDPAALVEARVRRVRRRGLVLGAVAAAATAGGIVAAVASRERPPRRRWHAPPCRRRPTGSGHRRRVAARGPLAADPWCPLSRAARRPR